MKRTITQFGLIIALTTSVALTSRSQEPLSLGAKDCSPTVGELPMISSAEVPLYPPLARVSNVEGVVCVRVETDGHKVAVAIAEKNGNSILARAAEANALTWRFAAHNPTTFTVTYRYKLVDDIEVAQNNPRVTLRLPTEIEVETLHWPGTHDMPGRSKSE